MGDCLGNVAIATAKATSKMVISNACVFMSILLDKCFSVVVVVVLVVVAGGGYSSNHHSLINPCPKLPALFKPPFGR
jgi:hypothetical protein